MNIHWIQHVPFEGIGCIETWLKENNHSVSCTKLWRYEFLPEPESIDGLIIMGGPMSVHDEATCPWLAEEKQFIKQLIDRSNPVLGICLGAQLIAGVLGSDVWNNEHREIGFFPVNGDGTRLPEEFTAFHWHGETFGIPENAVHLAGSSACRNQAFVYKEKVLALQFHLETTEQSLMELCTNCRDEITEGSFIQTPEEMRHFLPTLEQSNRLMSHLLEQLFAN
jgi:GMP synthase-like glutamine amidotransferase